MDEDKDFEPGPTNDVVNDIAKQMSERYSELISKDVEKIHKISFKQTNTLTLGELDDGVVRERYPTKKTKISPVVRQYYDNQEKLIHSFMEAETCVKTHEDSPLLNINQQRITDFLDTFPDNNKQQNNLNLTQHRGIAVTVSTIINICLLVSKIVAAAYSNSMSIITSVVDSGIDILTSIVIIWIGKSIDKFNIYKHPQGKRRLEPIGFLIISCVMSVSNFQIITESIKRMVTGTDLIPNLSYVSISIIAATVLIKFVLAIYCHFVNTPSTEILKRDHINDVISNFFALVGFVSSKYVWSYADSLFALIISLYIIFNWSKTAKENFRRLLGKSASPQDIQRLTWICMNHHSDIVAIDTVRAYTFGIRYLVEVDLVLPECMPLRETHDIGETLQQKLESLPEVERAFVHLDYESTHKPEVEHRVVCIS